MKEHPMKTTFTKISLVLLLVSLAGFLNPPDLQADDHLFIRVIATRANVRQAASTTAPVILSAEKGQVFDVLEKSGEWYAIQLATGAKGFLHASVVEEIVEAGAPAKPTTVVTPPPTPAAPAKPTPTAPTRREPVPAAPIEIGSPEAMEPFSMFLLRAGFFMAGDSAFGEVYTNGPVFGGELRIGKGKIVGWLEGTYRAHTGAMTFTGDETKMSVIAVEAGALYRFMSGPMTPYAGLGLGYHMFTETNDIRGEAKKSGFGFCALAGVTMSFGKNLVLDGRIKYSMCTMTPADFKIDVGGLTIGLGAGMRF
jgi:hypothetical protein